MLTMQKTSSNIGWFYYSKRAPTFVGALLFILTFYNLVVKAITRYVL